MIRSLLLLGLLLVTAIQAAGSFVVRDIDIRGLKSTRRWVVMRELQFGVGDTVSYADMEAAHKRLHNLKAFNDAELSTDTSGTVVVEISEAWPILPLLTVKLSRGSFADMFKDPKAFWNNLDLMAGVRHLNFRGEASELFAFGQLGASKGFFVGYQTRWLSPRIPLAVKTRVQYLEVTDRHAAIIDSGRTMRDDEIGVEAGTHGGARGRVGLGMTMQRVRQEHLWPAEGRNFDVAWLSPFAILDHRDLEWWPSRGGMAETRVDFGFGTEPFVRSQYGFRGYIPLRSWYSGTVAHRPAVLALAVGATTSTSSTPSFAHYYAGFEDGYRGYRHDRSESAGMISGTAEWRFPISPEVTYNVPLIGRWGRRWPLGISGVLFVQRTELQLNNRRTELLGYGAGAYVRVPYVQVAELAFARNKEGEPEFTLKLGVAF